MALTQQALAKVALMGQGSYSNSRDALRHQVWDTRYFAATPSDNTFFVQQIGASWSVGTKTKSETNMTDSGKLPVGHTFLVEAMTVRLLSQYEVGLTSASTWINASLMAQAYVNIMQNSVFEIKVQGREYDFQVHGSKFLPSLCINGYNAGTAGSVARIGDTVASGKVKLNETPIMLSSQVGFSVGQYVLQPDTTNINTSGKVLYNSFLWLYTYKCTMQVELEGMLTRPK